MIEWDGVKFSDRAYEVLTEDLLSWDPLVKYVKRLEKRFGSCVVAFANRTQKRGSLTARLHFESGYRNIVFKTRWQKTSGSL